MTGIAKVSVGAVVKLDDNKDYVVFRYADPVNVVVQAIDSQHTRTVALESIRCHSPAMRRTDMDLEAIPTDRLEEARSRHLIIKPLLDAGAWTTAEVEHIASSAGTSRATIYRWLNQYKNGAVLTNLMRKQRADVGVQRLDKAVEEVISEVIADYWLTPEKRTPAAAYREVKRRCWNADPRLPPPSLTTLISRLEQVDSKSATKKRLGQAAADKLELIKGTIPFADRPYAVIQIDHTPVDVHLVDEVHRVWIGRPWLTVAIDVHSRMVAGYYVSFDPPGTLATGICLANAMLSKKSMLAKHGLSYEYPCMGKPQMVHVDNAKEFHGKTLERACQEYGIDLMFRKIKTPRYGAHIERYLGSLMGWIQTLRGTSFSNVEEKGEYDAQGRAVMTLKEFELWLANLILGFYHNESHSSLDQRPPLAEYKRGILGDGVTVAAGVIEVITDEERLRMDFLPLVEVTVQPYGIKIDNINYQSDVLRRWVGSVDPKSKRQRRKFICRRDPRDISCIYFYDPDAQTYFRIPYRDKSHALISLWELRAIRRYLRDQGREQVNEAEIFNALNEMRRIEEAAVKTTSKTRRTRSATQQMRRRDSPQPASIENDGSTVPTPAAIQPESSPADVQPYEEVEWL